MVSSIVKIVIGLFVWKIIPGWIEYGSKNVRGFIQLCCNVIGVILVVLGVIDLIRQLLSWLSSGI